MAYIYNADIYCDSCGETIKQRLINEGKAPEDPDNESTFDSDDFPKYVDNEEESDSPVHCGSHADCLEAEELPDGDMIGCLIGTSLTSEGVDYVKEAVKEGGLVAEFWKHSFDWIDFD